MALFSFERADSKRTIGRQGCRRRRPGRALAAESVQERRRRDKKRGPGHSAAEVEHPIIVARRPPDEHVLDHLLGHPWRAAIADEIGAEYAASDLAEGHV